MAKRRNETKIIMPQGGAERVFHRKLSLEVMAGVDAGRAVVVEDKVFHIGTQSGNALQLSDQTVSGIHVEIKNSESGLRLRDLGSTNGTWVDSVRLLEALVPPGTVIGLGQSRVRITILDEQVSVPLSRSYSFGRLIGKSPGMRSIFELLERVAPSDETVLIVGETGTGKEVCATAIVEASPRRDGPLVVMDCGAIPPNLLESELFGHARGSFTGAVCEHRGAFERAQGGTLFLDEIGELPLELQTRLLRAVENRRIRKVGDTREIPLDIRILAATNRCLEEEVNRGTFRTDLYYRLSVVQVQLPPLRERPEDIPMLAQHLLAEMGSGSEVILSDSQLEELTRHRWPGNVRELRNYLRRVALGEGQALPGRGLQLTSSEPEFALDLSLPFKDCKNRATERFEQSYLRALMKQADGNISKAARIAQTDRTYLSRLLNKYHILHD